MAAKPVGHKSLECSDGDRRIDIFAAAGGFTRRAAHTSTDRGQWIGAASDQISIFKTSFGDRPNVAPGIGVHRTGILALDLPLPIVDRWNLDFVALYVHGWRSPTFRMIDADNQRLLHLRLKEKSSCVAWFAVTVAGAVFALSFFGLGYQALTEYWPGGTPLIS